MKKSTKIMLIVVAAVLALCIVITVCVSVMHKNDNRPLPSEEAMQTTTLQNGQNDVAPPLTSDIQQNQTANLQQSILGKWADSANMSGYEFFDDGYVTVTYVNLTVPVVNMPINGSTKGTYTIDGNVVTIKFSIYSKTITKTYSASVDGNQLTMRDLKDSDISTYERAASNGSNVTTSSFDGNAVAEPTGINGGWVSSDGNWRYTFNEDGTLKVSISKVVLPSVSADSLTGSYNGVYMTDDDEITIQFMVDGKKVTLEYDYKISGNTLSLEDSRDDVILFVRGNGAVSTDAGDLIGKWSDGSGMSGYEFKQGGVVEITYVNFTVPVINMPINGTYTGTYTVKGDKVTINASIYSKSVTNTYSFAVENNVLTLKAEDGSISTYMKK
ncbi:MAG: DUF5640 domain-containing protein [Ruminococcus sp.]|nr:DUF5640 domain-containing protein [Ruminococcus sp.]